MPTEAQNLFLTVDIERKGDESLVHCRGKLVSGGCSYLHSQVYPLIADSKRILLDVADLDWADSMGLGALVRLQVVSQKNGCQLQLINIGPQLHKLLTVTHLLGVLAPSGE